MRIRGLRILAWVAGVLGALVIALGVWGFFTARRSFPQVEGELRMPGLDAPVEVFRDSMGIPHIFAETQHDLFMAQGFVHAQDRFWQMDFQRHASAGRLSELVGSGGMDVDRFVRTLGWERTALRDIEGLDAETSALLEAYAEGVNAYLEQTPGGAAVSFEYAFIGLLNRGYAPAPWRPVNTVTWAKAMAWQLGNNLDLEIMRSVFLHSLGPDRTRDLFPPYPADNPIIVKEWGSIAGGYAPENTPVALPLDSASLAGLERTAAQVDRYLGPRGAGVGSNSWVISGELTQTGKPMLANDPHLGAQIPGLWYEVGLYCRPKGPDCPYAVTGYSLVGAPGVVIGHNDRIAWGLTDVPDDVQDLYIERIHPRNPNQYEYNGEWIEMEVITETLQVAGGDSEELQVRITRHGPIISGVYSGLEDFEAKTSLDLPEPYAIALRWTALEPSTIIPAILKMNRAQDWESFRDAARLFDVPAQNMVYADIEGNIGYQTPGRIPIRKSGDGTIPVPGWTDDYEWTGTIPFDELPSALNPPEGYIVSANNAIIGADYPYPIADRWDYGFRARRIQDMLESMSAPMSLDDMQRIQTDNENLNARNLVPLLLEITFEDPRLEEAKDSLEGWDYQLEVDSSQAALFESFWMHLLAETFHDEVPEDYWPRGDGGWFEVVRNLSADPQSEWWDDARTSRVEDRDEMFRRAFSAAVGDLEASLGDDMSRWAWGDVHTLMLRNSVMDNFPVVNQLFNRGPYRTSGGSSIVNNIRWNAAVSLEASGSVPSMRMIIDLADFSRSKGIHPTGQSGHAYHPHYIDMAEPWRDLAYHPMLWTEAEIRDSAESRLLLTP